MNEKNFEDEIDLLELAKAVWKRIWLVIILGVVCAVIGFLYTEMMVTPQYEADVTLIVNSRMDTTANVTNDQITSAQKLVDTYAVIIKSNTVLDEVINELGLDMKYDTLVKKVSVSAVNSTQIMKISVQDPSPTQAYQIAKAISQIAPGIIVDIVEAGSCKVVSKVAVSEDPVSPSVMKNTAIAAMVGIVIALAIIVIQFLTKEKHIVNDQDVKAYLDLPLLGVIPEVGE